MDKILNQDEIDALFHVTRGRARTSGSSEAEPKRVTACNFRQAGLITREHLRTVNMLHDTFARNLIRTFAAYLRAPMEVNLVSTEQMTYTEFLQHVPEVNYVASIHLRPFDAMAVVELDLPLAFPMIDLLLGGPGAPVEGVREITEVEEEILKGVLQIICRELQATWRPVMESEFQFDERQRQAQILRLMPPNEKVLALSYEIRVNEASGMLMTAFPAVVANALVRKLIQQGSYRRHRAGTGGSSSLREKLEKCSFPAELILPGGTVNSRRLLALVKGSILSLHSRIDEPAVLYVEKRALYVAQPVRSGDRRAALILRRAGSPDPRRSEKNEQ